MNPRPLLAGLFCVSAALLGYELLLMRLLSLAYWGHFAAFMISVALLGWSAAGLLLHFLRERVIVQPNRWFGWSAGLFAVSAPAAFVVSQALPFTPFLLAWSAKEYLHLAVRIGLYFVPFFCAGVAVGVPFVARLAPVGWLYFWNMLGSAAPCGLLLLGMSLAHPVRLLIPITALAALAWALATRSHAGRGAAAVVGTLLCLGLTQLPFRFSPYKDLSRTLTLPESRIVDERYDAEGVVHRVVSPYTRYLPGLSLNFAGELPGSELLFVDGSGMEVVFDEGATRANPEFLRMGAEAFSYRLRGRPRVLLLGGGPVEILRATAMGASEVVAVDALRSRAVLAGEIWDQFGSSPLRRSRVVQVVDEPRHFLAATHEEFEVILISQLGSHGAATAGAASLDAAWLFTVEGLQDAWQQLAPGGHLVLTTWVENPPRAGVRLAAVLVETLRRCGASDPGQYLLALRSWSTLTFFVARQPFDRAAIADLQTFAEANSFDLVHFPGIRPQEVNRNNVIPGEPYYAAIQSLLGTNAASFLEQSPFNVFAPADDRPFFSHFFRWRALPEFMRTLGRDWVPFVEWGYLLLVAALGIVAVLGLPLLLLPSALTRVRPRICTLTVFFGLGLAYIIIEMWAIYRLMFLLSRPMLATSVALATMLAASGAGAALLAKPKSALTRDRKILAALIALLAGVVALCDALSVVVFPQALWLRVTAAVTWVAVPAFFMGFPFPFALQQLRGEEIPWALAMNGFGSVLGSLLATLVAVHLGLILLGWVGVILYVCVAAGLWRREVRAGGF